jgi:hypothetical protein
MPFLTKHLDLKLILHKIYDYCFYNFCNLKFMSKILVCDM